MRAVIDTNILVRGIIKPSGSVGPVVRRLRDGDYLLVYSESLLEELVDVMARPRLRDKYAIDDHTVESLLRLVLLRGERVEPLRRVKLCRDPKDDKFLEAALEGKAGVVVSGDDDLLVLDPFEGIPIVSPGRFLALLDESVKASRMTDEPQPES